MIKDSLDLLARDSREPRQKFLHRSATFNVLEECFHRNAGVFKQPGTTDFARNSFHGGTL